MMIKTISDLNRYLFSVINSFAGKNVLLDKTAVIIAEYAVLIVPLFLLILWFQQNDQAKKEVLLILASLVLSLTFARFISAVYFQPRPFVVNLGRDLIQHSADASFPSDHAVFIFVPGFLLYFLKKYKSGIFFFLLALLAGGARVFSGIHFPLDILGSIFTALIGTSIVFLLKEKLDPLFLSLIKIYHNFRSALIKF